MVPPCSHRIPRVQRYSGYCQLNSPFRYRTFTFSGMLFHTLLLDLLIHYAVLTPNVLLPLVWPISLSLATTQKISVDFSSSPYLDVSVQAVPFSHLCIQHEMMTYCAIGFLHSDSCGSLSACDSPQHFVAYHVLHRLLMPRHSLCALCSLTFFSLFQIEWPFQFFLQLISNCSIIPIFMNILLFYPTTSLFPYSVFKELLKTKISSLRFHPHGGLKWT